jgi:hypothetical protein
MSRCGSGSHQSSCEQQKCCYGVTYSEDPEDVSAVPTRPSFTAAQPTSDEVPAGRTQKLSHLCMLH